MGVGLEARQRKTIRTKWAHSVRPRWLPDTDRNCRRNRWYAQGESGFHFIEAAIAARHCALEIRLPLSLMDAFVSPPVPVETLPFCVQAATLMLGNVSE